MALAKLKFCLAILGTWAVVVAANNAKPKDSSLLMQSPEVGVEIEYCPSLIYNYMADCVSFFSVGSNDKEPSYLCCLGYKEVLYTDAECICEGLLKSNNIVDLGVQLHEIDIAKAATLPSACGISAPFITSNCDAYPPSGNPPPETTPMPPMSLLVNKAPAPANGEEILNPAPAPPPIHSRACATTYSSALCFSLVMLVSLLF